MKKMPLILKYLLPVLIIFFYTVSVFGEEPETRVTIKGNISNIADAGEYIISQTHLQLYPCETTGKMRVQMGKNGKIVPVPGQTKKTFYQDGLNRLVPPSTLSRIGLPVFGSFIFFKVRNLEPGKCYKMFVMMLDKPYPGLLALTREDGSPLEIIIPEDKSEIKAGETKKEIVIDLTKEPLRIPEPQKR